MWIATRKKLDVNVVYPFVFVTVPIHSNKDSLSKLTRCLKNCDNCVSSSSFPIQSFSPCCRCSLMIYLSRPTVWTLTCHWIASPYWISSRFCCSPFQVSPDRYRFSYRCPTYPYCASLDLYPCSSPRHTWISTIWTWIWNETV